MSNPNLPFIIDPKTKEPSVTLSIWVISVFVMVVAIGLELGGVTHSTSSASEFFVVSGGLYLGRRWTSPKGTLDGNTPQ